MPELRGVREAAPLLLFLAMIDRFCGPRYNKPTLEAGGGFRSASGKEMEEKQ